MKPILILILAVSLVAGIAPAAENPNDLFQQALVKERTEGNVPEAIKLYQRIVDKYASNRKVAAQALLQLADCQTKLGDAQARKSLERLVCDSSDQKETVAVARARLAALGGPGAGGGLVARRVLTDASGVGGVLTADGKYIRFMEQGTGDGVQFEVASGQRSRITNRGPWSETEMYVEDSVVSRDGKQIVYNRETKDAVPELRIRNLDGSSLRTPYTRRMK